MSVGAVNKQTGERIPTAGMPAIDSVLSGSSTNPVQNRVVKAALDEKADTDIVASDFSTSASYTAGGYCIYEGKFYKFKANHSGAWAAADVDEIKIAGELSSLMSGLTNLIGDMPVKVFKDNIPDNGAISIQLAANKLYQYYTWRDSEGYVYMGLIDVAYTGLITNHSIIKPQVDSLSFTDGGNMVLSVANSTNYQAAILLYEVSK